MAAIDFSTDFGKHALERLESEQVVWLTTITPSGQPAPNPVWFLFRGDRVLIFSKPDQSKLTSIKANPKVALSFNSDPHGGDVVILNGIATTEVTLLDPADAAAYVVKYGDGMRSIGMTAEDFARDYNSMIVIELTKLRGFVE